MAFQGLSARAIYYTFSMRKFLIKLIHNYMFINDSYSYLKILWAQNNRFLHITTSLNQITLVAPYAVALLVG